jgi:hypothetical protein
VTDPDARHAGRVLALDAAFAALPAPCRRFAFRWREPVCLGGRAGPCGDELGALARFVRDLATLADELAAAEAPAPGAVTRGSGV